MSVAIRLRREGTKNTPFYRIVVADSRKRRDGRYIEQIGHYDPLRQGENFKIDLGKATDWVAKGARPSETVASLIKKARAKADSRFAFSPLMDAPLALREFLEYVVGSLIEHRDLASISQRQDGNRISFDVYLHPDDVGHVIGRSGHTAKALRNLMAAAGIREGLKVSLRVEPRSEGRSGSEPASES